MPLQKFREDKTHHKDTKSYKNSFVFGYFLAEIGVAFESLNFNRKVFELMRTG